MREQGRGAVPFMSYKDRSGPQALSLLSFIKSGKSFNLFEPNLSPL